MARLLLLCGSRRLVTLCKYVAQQLLYEENAYLITSIKQTKHVIKYVAADIITAFQ